jgi:hypothetical protein
MRESETLETPHEIFCTCFVAAVPRKANNAYIPSKRALSAVGRRMH